MRDSSPDTVIRKMLELRRSLIEIWQVAWEEFSNRGRLNQTGCSCPYMIGKFRPGGHKLDRARVLFDVGQRRTSLHLVLLVSDRALNPRSTQKIVSKRAVMKKRRIAESLAVAAQFMILMAAPGLTRIQNTQSQTAKPATSSQIQQDPYADAFAGLTYSDEQKAAISKIQQDIASRKAAVVKDEKLTADQKDAMLTGYTRMEYSLIYKELTPDQKKQVSTRMRAHRASNQAAQKTQTPTR